MTKEQQESERGDYSLNENEKVFNEKDAFQDYCRSNIKQTIGFLFALVEVPGVIQPLLDQLYNDFKKQQDEKTKHL